MKRLVGGAVGVRDVRDGDRLIRVRAADDGPDGVP